MAGPSRRLLHPTVPPGALFAVLVLVSAGSVRGQALPSGVPADTVAIPSRPPFLGGATGHPLTLEAGERIVTWAISGASVARRDAGGVPVPDAPPGDVVARFADGPAFAWPVEPTVWTAGRAERLSFGLNAREAHAPEGVGRVVVVRLGSDGSDVQRAFEPPRIMVERVDGGVAVRYADGAGFGLDRGSLRVTVRTARGVVYAMRPWAPVGEGSTVLPLPPPGIDLSPGAHLLEAVIGDRLGNVSLPATIVFDS